MIVENTGHKFNLAVCISCINKLNVPGPAIDETVMILHVSKASEGV